jgi:hypothetical protein
MFTVRRKAAEPMLGGARLAGPILSIRLRVDSSANLRGKLRSQAGHSALELAQKPANEIILGWFVLVFGLLVLLLVGSIGIGVVVTVSVRAGLVLGWVAL